MDICVVDKKIVKDFEGVLYRLTKINNIADRLLQRKEISISHTYSCVFGCVCVRVLKYQESQAKLIEL